ncbi:beta strand repeat-containing protein [Streptacidiphilus sp. N1-3]|uniref:Beta strand repeat-containing protein n=1 Tax=Streptacidiphilus alkalitolerans TaxID=3342712 RepID=A0ABV6X085_9ACTN
MRPIRMHRAVCAPLAALLGALSLGAAVTPAVAATRAAAAGAAAKAPSAAALSEAQASMKAVSSGKAVGVTAATTPTEVESANPNGSFTLTQSAEPVRKYTGGAWRPLDATLVRNADGSVSPTTTTDALTLSGGGAGALAVMKDLGRSLSLTLPTSITRLPAPTLSGRTATYPDVLSGVDLQVIADNQGGFSEVLVVKDAAAAADPALATLTFGAKAKGVALATDAAGNFTAKDTLGRTVFSAPAPQMWDSATVPAAASAPSPSARSLAASPTATDPRTGAPLNSSAAAPGEGAHVAPIKAAYRSGTLKLTPDAALLTGKPTVYPLYIDPSYTAGGKPQAWTYVDSYRSTTSFWKTTDDVGLRVGYQGWESPYYTGRAFVQMSVDSKIYGSVIDTSNTHFYATETYAPSCTAKPVELWTTGAISSSTTWATQPSWGTKLDTQSAAHGWSSSCPTASIGWNDSSEMSYLAAHPASTVTFGLRASDESDAYGWKKFDHATMSMTTTYNHKPAVASPLTTSPATSCTGTVKTVGNGDITLYAGVYDKDGGNLSATFNVTKTTGGATIATKTLTAASGHNAVYTLTRANLDSLLGTTAVTGVSWNVSVTDGSIPAGTSATCKFNFDPTQPGAPTVNDSQGTDCNDSTLPFQIGTPATFALVANAGGTAPASYLYQLNGAAPLSTTVPGFTITPTRGTNTLTVTSVSAGGNIGDTATCILTAAAAATATDADLTGDGTPDLALVGNQDNLPPGLWLSRGQNGTQVGSTAAQIGALGNGVNSSGSPADWNGTQALTGHFSTGAGLNDVLDYNPATGAGEILFGNGDGSALSPTSGSQTDISAPAFQSGSTNDFASSIASGGNLYNVLNGNPVTGFPDLLLIVDGQLLDEGSDPVPGAFTGVDNALPLSGTNPTGTGDWSGWTITTSQVDGLPALFARSTTGGQLYYYSPADLQNLALGGSVTPLRVAAAGWTSAIAPVLQAVDLNNDGIADLRAVGATGAVTGYLFNGSTLSTLSTQTLTTASHQWSLSDYGTPTALTAADNTSGTALDLTGTAGAAANTGDLFSPDVALAGADYLHTSGKALALNGSFTVSAWADPTLYGGAVLSQDGSADSGILLLPTASGWQFSLNTGAGTSWTTVDTITGGTVQLGAWTHLTATYNATTKVMNLYVDDIFVATGSHTAPATGATGNFRIGADQDAAANHDYFTGQLANVQTWTGAALPPAQPYTPSSYHQAVTATRILDTRSSTGVGNTTPKAPVGASSIAGGTTTVLQVSGIGVTPATAGAPTAIPSSVTAVAVDVTVTAQTGAGFVTAFADGTQHPVTSSSNYTANNTTTGYQIVPVGADGRIDLFNSGSSSNTVALIVDLTGYFTSDAGLTGDQTYTPLPQSTLALDTRSSVANTNLTATGAVPANTAFTLQVTGNSGVPADATAVATNLTTAGQTGNGYLEAYATGSAPALLTSLTYTAANSIGLASTAADIPLGTGGSITVFNHGSAADILVSVVGYYTAGTSGEEYHAVNPTRLVDTRDGTGSSGAAPIAAMGTYTLSAPSVQQITAAATPTLVGMLTVTDATAFGVGTVYPTGTTVPANSSIINWSAATTAANLALTPTSSTDQISFYNHSTGTVDLIVDCSGYFS